MRSMFCHHVRNQTQVAQRFELASINSDPFLKHLQMWQLFNLSTIKHHCNNNCNDKRESEFFALGICVHHDQIKLWRGQLALKPSLITNQYRVKTVVKNGPSAVCSSHPLLGQVMFGWGSSCVKWVSCSFHMSNSQPPPVCHLKKEFQHV